jgi:hypothetical protein
MSLRDRGDGLRSRERRFGIDAAIGVEPLDGRAQGKAVTTMTTLMSDAFLPLGINPWLGMRHLAERPEGRPDFLGEQVWLLPGGEVAGRRPPGEVTMTAATAPSALDYRSPSR